MPKRKISIKISDPEEISTYYKQLFKQFSSGIKQMPSYAVWPMHKSCWIINAKKIKKTGRHYET